MKPSKKEKKPRVVVSRGSRAWARAPWWGWVGRRPWAGLGVAELALLQRDAGGEALRVVCSASTGLFIEQAICELCPDARVVACGETYDDDFVKLRLVGGCFECKVEGRTVAIGGEYDGCADVRWAESRFADDDDCLAETRRLAVSGFGADFVLPSHANAKKKKKKEEGGIVRLYVAPFLIERETATTKKEEEEEEEEELGVEEATSSSSSSSSSELKVGFLGTGAARPSAARGESGILATWPEFRLLADCGVGTSSFLDDPATIDAVWVSHHHLDHAGGLPSVVSAVLEAKARAAKDNRAAAAALREGRAPERRRSGSVVLVAPPRVLRFWDIARRALGLSPVRCVQLEGATHVFRNEDVELVSVRVEHCRDSYALIARHRRAKERLVFSGDCRPSDALVAKARRGPPTILVHEATFSDDRKADAISKRHSTVSEALEVARRIEPRATVLTHFSQHLFARGAPPVPATAARRRGPRGRGPRGTSSCCD
ncbi:hypothetical protein CTAYLR_004867 [Chrysophaeum taylorii]|uniref:ribonuclease Z n=1 Tax=Chrysophaeum taylorii TaxID=2483200 RepID=A0AAD7UET7_9STRA|nr:hypothetical protein CTAYLR_004867 [Chrysophaeum taylorii]